MKRKILTRLLLIFIILSCAFASYNLRQHFRESLSVDILKGRVNERSLLAVGKEFTSNSEEQRELAHILAYMENNFRTNFYNFLIAFNYMTVVKDVKKNADFPQKYTIMFHNAPLIAKEIDTDYTKLDWANLDTVIEFNINTKGNGSMVPSSTNGLARSWRATWITTNKTPALRSIYKGQ